jgi:hypothetical protein
MGSNSATTGRVRLGIVRRRRHKPSTFGELISNRPELLARDTTLRRVAAVLHETAIELNAGRVVPIGVRRAVRALANELRSILDPRPNSATDPSSHSSPVAASGPQAERLARAQAVLAHTTRRLQPTQARRRTDSVPGTGVIPVPDSLRALLPEGGLRRGSIVRVPSSTSLLFALLAEASAQGMWCGDTNQRRHPGYSSPACSWPCANASIRGEGAGHGPGPDLVEAGRCGSRPSKLRLATAARPSLRALGWLCAEPVMWSIQGH